MFALQPIMNACFDRKVLGNSIVTDDELRFVSNRRLRWSVLRSYRVMEVLSSL